MKRPAQQLRALEQLHDVLTIETIAEQVESMPVAEPAAKARAVMAERRYDVLTVSRDGNHVGYLFSKDLDGRDGLEESSCGTLMRGFDECGTVQESMSLAHCIPAIQKRGYLFVEGMSGVDRIVTQADLHKIPVRMLLFSVISLLEMALLSLIRGTYEHDEEWKPLLSKRRLLEAEKLLEKRSKVKQDIDLLDCLQLVDKGTIVKKTDSLRKGLGFHSKTRCGDLFRDLDDIRNPLAHGQPLDEMLTLDWHKVVDTFQKAKSILEKSIDLLDQGA